MKPDENSGGAPASTAGAATATPPHALRVRRTPTPTRLIGLVAALTLFGGFLRFYWSLSSPPIPQPLHGEIVFPRGVPGAIEPLVVTGVFSAGDFLSVRYLDSATAVFSYDSWGAGGPSSAPFRLEPGTKRTVQIEMPSLHDPRDARSAAKAPVRVVLDGREVFSAAVPFHNRTEQQVYFAANPIGGTPGPTFRGVLMDVSGRQLRGSFATLVSLKDRARWFWGRWAGFLIAAAFFSGIAGFGVWRAGAAVQTHLVRRRANTVANAASRSAHRMFAFAALLSVALFAGSLTGGSFRLIYPDSFGDFYDYQAQSLLEGRLDVPQQALNNESFVFGGKYFGYFGPAPALLRMPFVVAGVGFGQLTGVFLVVYFGSCLLAAYCLLRDATRTLFGPAESPSRATVLLFVGACGPATTLFFLSSRAYVYHEAILCGVAFALWGSYAAFRFLRAPRSRWWISALICGTLAVQARPPAGLFALGLLGTVALAQLIQREGVWRPLAIGAVAAAGILSFNGLSYLKFKTFDGAPLRYHIQYHADRLARFGGKNFHVSNIRHNLDAYVLAPDFVVRRDFPWFYIGPEREYPEARLDMAEPTLAMPYAMPALFSLAVIGAIMAFVTQRPARRPLIVLAVAVTPMALALLMAVATSHRYTADFCPFLIACAAWGVATLDRYDGWIRRTYLWGGTLLLVITLPITFALTMHYQGAVVWGTPDDIRHHYENLRRQVDQWFARP